MHFSKTQLNKTQSKQTEEEVKEIIVFSYLPPPSSQVLNSTTTATKVLVSIAN